MTTYANAITVPSAAIVTALATAVTNAQALSVALAPGVGGPLTAPGAFLAGCTLQNLATSTTGWKMSAADMRVALAAASANLALAGRQFGDIAATLSAIGSLD